MSNKGFLESLLDSMALWAAVQDSRDSSGKPNPYKAAGIAFGMRGDLSTEDILKLGGHLGNAGAFSSGSAASRGSGYAPCAPDDSIAAASPLPECESMDQTALSDAEKEYRIQNEQYIKALCRYWSALWTCREFATRLPPLELAAIVWKEASENDAANGNPDPELRDRFARWLRIAHDIRMDSENKMHPIKHKEKPQ